MTVTCTKSILQLEARDGKSGPVWVINLSHLFFESHEQRINY